ncbi:MAG: hypothetical protein GXP45_08570 [bacterium]|nr:hypothetical protein [bacterium]
MENIYDHIDEIATNIQKKLISGKELGFHSKKMIELMHVDEAEQYRIDDFKLDPDLSLYRQILVNKYQFQSLNKVIDELKKKYLSPTQNSLF